MDFLEFGACEPPIHCTKPYINQWIPIPNCQCYLDTSNLTGPNNIVCDCDFRGLLESMLAKLPEFGGGSPAPRKPRYVRYYKYGPETMRLGKVGNVGSTMGPGAIGPVEELSQKEAADWVQKDEPDIYIVRTDFYGDDEKEFQSETFLISKRRPPKGHALYSILANKQKPGPGNSARLARQQPPPKFTTTGSGPEPAARQPPQFTTTDSGPEPAARPTPGFAEPKPPPKQLANVNQRWNDISMDDRTRKPAVVTFGQDQKQLYDPNVTPKVKASTGGTPITHQTLYNEPAPSAPSTNTYVRPVEEQLTQLNPFGTHTLHGTAEPVSYLQGSKWGSR